MAHSLASTGTSAQIIYLPTAALQPVQQQRGPGRRPSSVINLRRYKCDHVIAVKVAQQDRVVKIAELRGNIAGAESYLREARANLLALTQISSPARLGASHV